MSGKRATQQVEEEIEEEELKADLLTAAKCSTMQVQSHHSAPTINGPR